MRWLLLRATGVEDTTVVTYVTSMIAIITIIFGRGHCRARMNVSCHMELAYYLLFTILSQGRGFPGISFSILPGWTSVDSGAGAINLTRSYYCFPLYVQ